MRAAIYARYSSDKQSDSSIDDQIEICRRYAELKGWKIADIFADRAISGASSSRPGYLTLLDSARSGDFDVIIAESLDRLSRRVADVAALHDELSFKGIALHTVATGEVNALLAGILGSVSQQYLLDLKDKTKRGILGRVLDGKSGGGLAFGYRLKSGSPGVREIDPVEAIVVERIFRDFAAGQSPRAIAKALNGEGIPGPGGRPWRDTTIRGQRDRGTGILNNDLYVGRLVWNRCSYVKDPRTGRRKARPNPQDKWEVVPVPDLRIIEDALWEAVKTRQHGLLRTMARDAAGNSLNRAHRRKFLFSGLLRCGQCGGGFTIVAKDRYGCASRRSQGICANNSTIGRSELEERVLSSLQARLMAPELVATFIEEYTAELDRAARKQHDNRAAQENELASVQRKITGILHAIEDGLYAPSMKERLTELERRKTNIEECLASDPPPPLRIHPGIHKIYEHKVRDLVAALNAEAIRTEASDILRSLIEKIELTPESDGPGCVIEIHGDLATILAFCASDEGKEKRPSAVTPERQWSVVAGAGFEPATFRL